MQIRPRDHTSSSILQGLYYALVSRWWKRPMTVFISLPLSLFLSYIHWQRVNTHWAGPRTIMTPWRCHQLAFIPMTGVKSLLWKHHNNDVNNNNNNPDDDGDAKSSLGSGSCGDDCRSKEKDHSELFVTWVTLQRSKGWPQFPALQGYTTFLQHKIMVCYCSWYVMLKWSVFLVFSDFQAIKRQISD